MQINLLRRDTSRQLALFRSFLGYSIGDASKAIIWIAKKTRGEQLSS